MFGRSIQLFSLFGIPLRIDLSWMIAVLLIVWSLAASVFPTLYAGLTPAVYWMMAIAGAISLFGSIVLHEVGHALVARVYGMAPQGITLFMLGGIAEMRDEPSSPAAEFWVAIAGPLVTLFVVLASAGLVLLGTAAGWPLAVTGLLWWLALVNATVLLFNMLPAFPLDGGRVLRAGLWKAWGNLLRATRITSRIGGGFGLVFLFLGVVNLLFGNIIGAIWMVLIGLFLRNAAGGSYRQLLMREALAGQPVRRFVTADAVAVPADMPVQQVIETYIYRYGRRLLPVVEQGRPVGYVSMQQVKRLPEPMRATRPVSFIMQPLADDHVISPDADALDALASMARTGSPRLLVIDGEVLVGTVARGDILRFVATHAELDTASSQSGARFDRYNRAPAE